MSRRGMEGGGAGGGARGDDGRVRSRADKGATDAFNKIVGRRKLESLSEQDHWRKLAEKSSEIASLNCEELQILFYRLIHPVDASADTLGLLLREAFAIKFILPRLFGVEGMLLKEGGIDETKIWKDEEGHGGMNIFSSFFFE